MLRINQKVNLGIATAGLMAALALAPLAPALAMPGDTGSTDTPPRTITTKSCQDGWNQTEGGWAYYKDNQRLCSRWILDGGSWYYLGEDGITLTGLHEINGASYFFDAQSTRMGTGWIADGEDWYYANASGALQTGWQKVNGSWYWFDPTTNVMATGVTQVGNASYLLTSSGAMATGWGIDPATGSWCLANSSGDLQRGWQKVGGSWYLMGDDYRMLTGRQQVGNSWYWMASGGQMATGWTHTPEGWYYASGSGALASGWQKVNGSWYWLDPSTSLMVTGLTQVNGRTYLLEDSGAMATAWVNDGTCERYFDENGTLLATVEDDVITWADADKPTATGLVQIGGRCYYIDPQTGKVHHGRLSLNGLEYVFDEKTGILHSGWVQDSAGQWSHYEDDGTPRTGWSYIGNRWYWFDSAGIMKTGWLQLDGAWYYLSDSGAMATGWAKVDGTWYLLTGSGSMLTGWQSVNGTWYYLRGSGAMATGWIWDGTWYELSGSGAWITTHYHNIEWAGQPNNYYCGPTSGYMVLRNVGAWHSASGDELSIYNVAQYMHTDEYGYTSFQDRWFSRGMNAWLGSDVYTSVHTPSYETVRDAIMSSYRNGYATVVDEQERRGGPHFNGHNNGTFAHLMVVDGYDQSTDAVYIADPGAPTLWPSGSSHFWYSSLREFVQTYMQSEINGARERIGVHYAK